MERIEVTSDEKENKGFIPCGSLVSDLRTKRNTTLVTGGSFWEDSERTTQSLILSEWFPCLRRGVLRQLSFQGQSHLTSLQIH